MKPEEKIAEEAKYIASWIPTICMLLLFGMILATCSVKTYDATWKGQHADTRSQSDNSGQ